MSATSTYGNQEKLGNLPIPELSETAETYLASVRPLLTAQEYQWTQDSIAEFIKPGGVGSELHKRLVAHAQREEAKGKSWLETWWLEHGYLRGRYPLPIELSCHLVWKDSMVRSKGLSQTQQAAKILYEHVKWKALLETEKVPPQTSSSRPLCMEPFKTIFTSERQPEPEIDRLVTITPKENVVVLVNNQFYLLEYTNKGKPLSASELEVQLARIKEDAFKSPAPQHGVGSFTTLPRDEWAAIRARLSSNPINAATLNAITHCALILSLDSHSPWTEDSAIGLVAASGEDRWFDKAYGIIAFENARIGAILEHTPCDAPIIATMVDATGIEAAKVGPIETIRPLSSAPLPAPKKLEWVLDDSQLQELEAAALAHKKKAEAKVYHNFHWSSWGTKFLKKSGVSPDTFIQLAFQLAYFKAHQTFVATYESAHTRFYKHGRTECVRTLTTDAQEFVRTMESSAPTSTKYFLFKKAEATHKKQMSRAVQGRGCDRHLLGLKLIHATEFGGDLPAVFQDPAMAKSTNFQLSTSNVPGRTFHGGFGNPAPDGYGCCYILNNDSFDVSIVADAACPSTNVTKFGFALHKSLTALGSLLTEVHKSKL